LDGNRYDAGFKKGERDMEIGIYGIGTFGFAFSYLIGKKYKVIAYDRNRDLINYLRKNRRHLYHFRNRKAPKNVEFTNDLNDLDKANHIIMAVPSFAVREVAKNMKHFKNKVIINTAKALERKTAKRLSRVIKEEMDAEVAQFSGGTFATDIIKGAPLGADLACEDVVLLRELQSLFSFPSLRIYGNADLAGVEYAGAFKNVIAIFAGIMYGLRLPYGSITHMISRAAKEARDIAIALGAKSHTFSMESQCWGNDLWMSCTGKSRNREFGVLIGKGMDAEKALKIMGKQHKMVEGYYTLEAIPKLKKVKADILTEIYEIVFNGKDARKAIKDIMEREPEMIE